MSFVSKFLQLPKINYFKNLKTKRGPINLSKKHVIHNRLYTLNHKQWKSGLKSVLFRRCFVFVYKRITIKHFSVFQDLNVLFKPTNNISGLI